MKKGSTSAVLLPLALLAALARTDFRAFLEFAFRIVRPGVEFLPAPYLDALAYQLTQFAQGHITRMIVDIPPRYLKSFCCSVALPAWLMGRNPELRIACVSYSNDLSKTHANDFRALVKSKWYRQLFPGARFGAAKDNELEISTSKRGYRYATSLEATLTGRGGDILIIDDPNKADDAASPAALEKTQNWYRNTASTRLDNKESGKILVVMQRLHCDDLAGYLAASGSHWRVVAYPAIAVEREVHQTCGVEPWIREVGDVLHPQRESLKRLDEAKATLGSAQFSAQYQQMPVPAEGNLIRRSWFLSDRPPERQAGDIVIQSWDTASKDGAQNDYSACVTALRRGRIYYILDVFRARLLFPDLKRAVARLAERFQPNYVLIEDTGAGTSVSAALKDDTGVQAIPIKPQGNKEQRVFHVSGVLEGYMRVPHSAPWLDEFLDELAAFPNMRHDDQVDALTQLLAWAELRRRMHDDVKIGMPISVGGERSYFEQLHHMPGMRPVATHVLGLPGFPRSPTPDDRIG